MILHLPGKHCGEGNGNPLQHSCLENPRDGGAWWASVYGVTQSWTRLKRLSMHAWVGEGNGTPLQYSCMENPRDGGDWWAAVYGVTQSRTRLKRLSSCSRNHCRKENHESVTPWPLANQTAAFGSQGPGSFDRAPVTIQLPSGGPPITLCDGAPGADARPPSPGQTGWGHRWGQGSCHF